MENKCLQVLFVYQAAMLTRVNCSLILEDELGIMCVWLCVCACQPRFVAASGLNEDRKRWLALCLL